MFFCLLNCIDLETIQKLKIKERENRFLHRQRKSLMMVMLQNNKLWQTRSVIIIIFFGLLFAFPLSLHV